MLKFIQTTRIAGIVFGSAALVALIAAAPIAPAAAQGVPSGLLRLDSSQSAPNDDVKLTEAQQAKVRAAYARAKKNTPAQ
jgi:Spy/CpxP family protein refolding chaperone